MGPIVKSFHYAKGKNFFPGKLRAPALIYIMWSFRRSWPLFKLKPFSLNVWIKGVKKKCFNFVSKFDIICKNVFKLLSLSPEKDGISWKDGVLTVCEISWVYWIVTQTNTLFSIPPKKVLKERKGSAWPKFDSLSTVGLSIHHCG